MLHSTNEHDVHSPFVYDFVTKCLYSKPKKSSNKTLDVLLKCIAYRKARTIQIIGNSSYETLIDDAFPNIAFNVFPADLIFIAHPTAKILNGLLSEEKIHNDSVLLLGSIHENIETQEIWKKMAENKFFNVSIDMFYCGALFRRKEQKKEHFTIRI